MKFSIVGLGGAQECADGRDDIRSHYYLDAAIVCISSSVHLSARLAAARAGCHMLLEKPLRHTLAHRLFAEGRIGRAIAGRSKIQYRMSSS